MPPWITLASSPRTMPRAGHLCSLEASHTHTHTQNKRLRKRLSSDRYTHRLAVVSTIRYTCSQINMDVLLGRHIQGWIPYTQSYTQDVIHRHIFTPIYTSSKSCQLCGTAAIPVSPKQKSPSVTPPVTPSGPSQPRHCSVEAAAPAGESIPCGQSHRSEGPRLIKSW